MKKTKQLYKRKIPKYAGGVQLDDQQQEYLNIGENADNIAVGALDNFKKPGTANVALNTATGTLKGAGEGAKLGSFIGPEGTLIGAGVGAVVGGVTSFIGAEAKKKKLAQQTAMYQQGQLQQNKFRSDEEIAQMPNQGQGVTDTQYYSRGGFILGRYNQKNGTYYAKGGIIDKYMKKMAEGGDIDGPGDPILKTPTISTGTIGFPKPNDPYWKTHPLWTEHTDGTYREWGETPPPLDLRTLQQKLGAAASYQPDSAIIPNTVVNGTGDGARPAMIMQRKGPVVQAVHSTSGYYATGGGIPHRRGYSNRPSPYGSAIIDPDQLEYNPVQTDANYNFAAGGSIHINPANKGKFNATKKATGESTEELTHSDNPVTKKRAIFAQNAAKWKHEQGGEIANPQYEVEKGEIVQGNPLLEQSNQLASDMHQVGGETHENGGTNGIGGERVFSDRLKISPELLQILRESKISVSPNDSYADAATKLGKLKGKMEDKTASNYQPSINTGKRILDRVEQATDALFQDQEMQKAMTANKQMPVKGYAMGGRIPKYADGTDLSDNTIADAQQQGIQNPTIDNSQVQNVTLANPLTPDVHPSFGHDVVDGVNSYIKNNQGEVTNFADYLANLGSIHQLDTTVKRAYMAPPVYNYVNRSGEQVAQNQRTFNTALKSLTGSSRGVSGSNAGALYASTLENNSKIMNNENLRHDAYNESYSGRANKINAENVGITNQASDATRDLNNNKYVTLPLQARNAWLQGVMANEQVKSQQRSDKVKMALALASNDQNGVMSRFMKNYNNGGKQKLNDLLKDYGFGDGN